MHYLAGVNFQDTIPYPQVTTLLELGFATVDLAEHSFDEGTVVLCLLACRERAGQ